MSVTVTFNDRNLEEIQDGTTMEIQGDDTVLLVHVVVDGEEKVYYRHLDEEDVKFPFPIDTSWKELG